MKHLLYIVFILCILPISCKEQNKQPSANSDGLMADSARNIGNEVVAVQHDAAIVPKKKIRTFEYVVDRESFSYHIGNEVITTTLIDDEAPEEYIKFFYKPTPQDRSGAREHYIPSKDTILYYGLSVMITIDEETSNGIHSDTVYLIRSMLAPYVAIKDIMRYRLTSFTSKPTLGDTLVFVGSLMHSSPNICEGGGVSFNYVKHKNNTSLIFD